MAVFENAFDNFNLYNDKDNSSFGSLYTASPSPGLYFLLRDRVYLSGDRILITDVGDTGTPGSSFLACVTSNVNTRCCRSQDGGDMGEWHFPNGTLVSRANGADFVQFRFLREVRLNRDNTATMPSGVYQCRVPDERNSSIVHTANITLKFSEFYSSNTHFLCSFSLS